MNTTQTGDQMYSIKNLVYGYRPPKWRRPPDKWDWRVFAELVGERSESFLQANSIVAGTQAHQVFIGPSALEIYHNYTVSFGAQVPIYQGLGSVFPKERVRFAVNFSYLLFRYSNILTRRFVRKKSPPFCRSCYSPPRPQPKSGLLTSLSLEWIEKCVHTPCACL